MMSMRHLFIVTLFTLTLSLWGGSLSADCGQPHGTTESPSDEGGTGDAASTTTDTGTTGDTTVQGQLGTTLDPSQGLDRGGGVQTFTGIRSLYDPLQAYFELLALVNEEVRQIRSERAARWAKNKARNDAGVEDAFEAWSQAGGDLADKMIRIDEIDREIRTIQHELETEKKFPDFYRHGEKMDNFQKRLDHLHQGRVEAHSELQEAAEKRHQTYNRFLESDERAEQLQEQYYNQAMEGK